jgi:hypothetical protein
MFILTNKNFKFLIPLALIIFIIVLLIIKSKSMESKNEQPKVNYGSKVAMAENSSVDYPDFTLTYKGITKNTAKFSNGNSFTFTNYNFEVREDNKTKMIKWSAGTGDIGPWDFNIKGQTYWIEKIAKNMQKDYGDYDNGNILKLKEGEIIIIIFDKDHPPFSDR